MAKSSRIFLALVFGGLFCVLSAAALIIFAVVNVPNFEEMRKEVVVPIKLANGTKSTRRVGPKAPDWVPMNQIANSMLMAVIASEDTSFFSHEGIDFHELKESMKKDIQEKRWARGGSTLTQQVIKNVYLSPEKTLTRKVKELIWARELDKKLSKHEILCFHVNMAEFGPGIYGVKAASRHYFNTTPAGLTPRQSAFLAMMLPAPTKYYVYFRQKKLTVWATKRINQILRVMNRMGFIDEEAYQSAIRESLWGETPQVIEGDDAVAGEEDDDLSKIPAAPMKAPSGEDHGEKTMSPPPYPPPSPVSPTSPKPEDLVPSKEGEFPVTPPADEGPPPE